MTNENEKDLRGLDQNIQGRVSSLIDTLPLDHQRQLIFLFVEHVMFINHEVHDEYIPHLKNFFNGLYQFCFESLDFDTVMTMYHHSIQISGYNDDFENGGMWYPISPLMSSYQQKEHELIYLLCDWCCKEEYRLRRMVIQYKKHLKASHFSSMASFLKALSIEYADWNSEDIQKRKEARSRGREISRKEAEWQLEKIQTCAAQTKNINHS